MCSPPLMLKVCPGKGFSVLAQEQGLVYTPVTKVVSGFTMYDTQSATAGVVTSLRVGGKPAAYKDINASGWADGCISGM